MFGQHDHHDEDKNDNEHTAHATDTLAPSDGTADETWQHPGVPLNTDNDDNIPSDDQGDDNGTSEPDTSADQPNTPHNDEHAAFTGHTDDQTAASADEPTGADEDLADLKLQALSKLSPLVNHLDQSPEEKFRTLMMMIQASDDQSLVGQAYQTSLSISDEKERAQALLDIVNEINYFTQNPAGNQ